MPKVYGLIQTCLSCIENMLTRLELVTSCVDVDMGEGVRVYDNQTETITCMINIPKKRVK